MVLVESTITRAPSMAAPQAIKMNDKGKRKGLLRRILATFLARLTGGNNRRQNKKNLRRKQQTVTRNNLTMDFFNGATAGEDDDDTLSSSTISPTYSTYTKTISELYADDFVEHLPPLEEEPEENTNVEDESEQEAEKRITINDPEASLPTQFSVSL